MYINFGLQGTKKNKVDEANVALGFIHVGALGRSL